MKKLLKGIGSILSLLVLLLLVLGFIWLLRGRAPTGSVSLQSPLPTPTSPRATPSPPRATPTPLKATPTPPVTPPSPVSSPWPTPVFRAENVQIVEEIQLTNDGQYVFFPASWSPDGSQILIPRQTGNWIRTERGETPITELRMIDSSSGSSQSLTTGYAGIWSPDGVAIAYGAFLEGRTDQHEVGILDLTSKHKTVLATGPDVDASSWRLAWLSGERLVFKRGGQISSIRRDGTDERPFLSAGTWQGDLVGFLISPDGKKIAVTTGDDLWLMDVNGTQQVLLTNRFSGIIGGMAWSPDSRKLIYSEEKGHPYIVSADGATKIEIGPRPLPWGRGTPYSFSWSPDSNVACFGVAGDTYLVNADGTGLRNLTQSEPATRAPETRGRDYSFPVWSADGTKITFEKRDHNVWIAILRY